jgi:hypothetical protein
MIYKIIILGKFPQPSNIKGERKANRKFMQLKELNRYILLVSYLLAVSANVKSTFISYGEIMSEFWKKSGTINTTKYYAEVYRLILVYLSNERTRDYKTWVAVSRKSGIPKNLPRRIKKILVSLKNGNDSQENILVLRAFFTVITFIRGISGFHTPKFNSIVDPFNGKASVVPLDLIEKSIRNLNIPKFKSFSQPRFFIPSKAGANSNLVLISIGLDLLALIDNPLIWLNYVKWCIKYHFYNLLFIFVLFSMFSLPLYLVYKLLQILSKYLRDSNASWNPYLDILGVKSLDQLYLGRLAIVEEARQKARVVGITDWWSQILLKPLHDYLSHILKNIPEDGTFNQSGPINKLFFNTNILGKLVDPINSVDLSNATDRLPVNLQADILNSLGIDGDLWKALLARDYYVPHLDKTVRYAVGQPMGAYSSFNMLALSNHIINQIALLLGDVKYVPGTGQYAVLGDDVAIKVTSASLSYKQILNDLGVETNPIKGFSGNVVEFAKRIYFNCNGSVHELSPLGAKAIVNSIRSPLFLVSVLLDLNKKSFVYDNMLNRCIKILASLYNKSAVSLYLYAFCILGPQGGLWPNPKDNNPDITPLNVDGANFLSVKVAFEDLVQAILGIELPEVNAYYAWELQKLSAKPQSLNRELFKILDELSLLLWTNPYSKGRMNTYHKFSRYTLAIYSSLLAIFISLPFVLNLTIERFITFVSVEILKWGKRRRFGKTIPIPIHLHYLPILNPFKKGFNLIEIYHFFISGMSSSNFFSYKGEEWDKNFLEFKVRNKLDGNDPIRYFMWDYHYAVPFNVIINKLTITKTIDELSAMRMAKGCLSLNDKWALQIKNNKKAKIHNDRSRRSKRKSKH